MRFTVLRMLSTNSLTAFSASIAATGIGVAPAGSTGPISRVRASGLQGQPQSNPTPKLAPAGSMDGAPQSRSLPRGSLLDLSV